MPRDRHGISFKVQIDFCVVERLGGLSHHTTSPVAFAHFCWRWGVAISRHARPVFIASSRRSRGMALSTSLLLLHALALDALISAPDVFPYWSTCYGYG